MAEDIPAWDINPQLPQLRKNIQNKIESGGNYGAIGPDTGKMGRGLGVGQVMSANLPEWSRAILGREISEKEFLGNKRLQDRIINNKLGEYLNSTGNPADAASMWFTGKPLRQGANRADVFGTTGAQYAKTATQGLPPAEKARPKWDTGGESAPVQQARPKWDTGNTPLGPNRPPGPVDPSIAARQKAAQPQGTSIGEAAGAEAQAMQAASGAKIAQWLGLKAAHGADWASKLSPNLLSDAMGNMTEWTADKAQTMATEVFRRIGVDNPDTQAHNLVDFAFNAPMAMIGVNPLAGAGAVPEAGRAAGEAAVSETIRLYRGEGKNLTGVDSGTTGGW